MIFKKSIFAFSLFLLFASCTRFPLELRSGAKKTERPYAVKTDSLSYGEVFLQKINSAKESQAAGDFETARRKVLAIRNETLRAHEAAAKYNLLGVIYYSASQYEDALRSFDEALKFAQSNPSQLAQIYLNQAGLLVKMDKKQAAFEILKKSDSTVLTKEEFKKYHVLRYRLATELNYKAEEVDSLIHYLGSKESYNDLRSDPHFEKLKVIYFELSDRDRLKVLSQFQHTGYLCIGLLAYYEAEKRFYSRDKKQTELLLDWVKNRYASVPELIEMSNRLNSRIDNYAKVDRLSIGVVLPLSGDKKDFGQRVLDGLDNGIKTVSQDSSSYNILIRDSEGSAPVGAFRVKELVEKYGCAVVIGGVFASEATQEYLEAKKYGAFFISLSQVYLPKDQKDHLLLELPGSIESQLDQIFSPVFLNKFGRRVAILYPKEAKGEAYVDEFWRRSVAASVTVTSILPFERGRSDYRETVKDLLELKYPRGRKEEYDLLSEVQSLERTAVRRVQVLGPIIDFDWVFIPAFPKETLQIIPSFAYFDAFKVNFVGDPSWRNQLMAQELSRNSNVYFIADNLDPEEQSDFIASFQTNFKRRPKLLELMGHDALQVTHSLMQQSSFASRDELDVFLRSRAILRGMTGDWTQKDGVWIKTMGPFGFKRSKIEKLKL